MLRYQNIKIFFAEVYTPKQSEEAFVIKKFKNLGPSPCVIGDLNS